MTDIYLHTMQGASATTDVMQTSCVSDMPCGVFMEPTGTDKSIRQALAIAIVRQRRKLAQEAESWRTKAQRLQQQLEQQQLSHLQLQRWTNSVLQGASAEKSTTADTAGHEEDQSCTRSMFLPPLALQACCGPQELSTQELYTSLQQQLMMAAQASSTTTMALTEALDSKASVLGDMLLTNIQTLQSLQTISTAGCGQADAASGAVSGNKQTNTAGSADKLTSASADVAAQISDFVQNTLLHTPNSSLRSAYMRRCASLLAALLAHMTAGTPDLLHKQAEPDISAASPPLQHETGAMCSKSEVLMPTQILGCISCLIQHTLHTSTDRPQAAAGADDWHKLLHLHDVGAAASARMMLQQLSLFPSTALLMTVALSQQLCLHVQQLQHVNATVETVQLAGLTGSLLSTACEAAQKAANSFEQSHELLEQLDEAITQLPTWVAAVMNCSWSSQVLEDLVAAIAHLYTACLDLQRYQPLLAVAVCQLSASLATRLQHVATNTQASGLQDDGAAAVRSLCGKLCVKLRDLFMP